MCVGSTIPHGWWNIWPHTTYYKTYMATIQWVSHQTQVAPSTAPMLPGHTMQLCITLLQIGKVNTTTSTHPWTALNGVHWLHIAQSMPTDNHDTQCDDYQKDMPYANNIFIAWYERCRHIFITYGMYNVRPPIGMAACTLITWTWVNVHIHLTKAKLSTNDAHKRRDT